MLHSEYSHDFFLSFTKINYSLSAYWNDSSYGDQLFNLIDMKAQMICKGFGLGSPYFRNCRRFFVHFHGIEYAILYTVEGDTLYVDDIVYSKSSYFR